MFVFLDNLYPEYIYIEDGASINAGSMILTHFNPMKQYAPIMQARVAPAVIRKNAIVTIKSTILPGVMVGQNAIVSAGSVVNLDLKGTYDPDGDDLVYKWWVMPESGTYEGDIDVRNQDSTSADVVIPADASG
jgi:carbonic anhydrase/acetyltransferase-like protein (isoleucine patch superfamily)